MKFYVMTLFPQMILDGLNTSITGRAIESGALSVEAVDIRDFSQNKHLKVDDYPYGGGAGMVMQAGPVCDAYESIAARMKHRTLIRQANCRQRKILQRRDTSLADGMRMKILVGNALHP